MTNPTEAMREAYKNWRVNHTRSTSISEAAFTAGYQAALSTLPRLTEAEIVDCIKGFMNNYYYGHQDLSNASTACARSIRAKLPHIFKED